MPTVMLSRYQLEGVLAQGAQSRVLNAVEKSSGLRCLVKLGPEVCEEAIRSLELNHPYMVLPQDCGTDAEYGPFAVYPFVSGKSLHEVCEQDQDRFQVAAFQIADFLAFLHQRGWLYNDFKPEHFLVGEKQVRILDMGLCSPLKPYQVVSTFSGTFPYIAPERLLGRPHDGRSDLYAFGMLLLAAFFPDKVPHAAPSMDALLEFQGLSDRLHGRWRDLILDLTSQEPAQRPASAAEVWNRLLKPVRAKSVLFFPLPFYREVPLESLAEAGTWIFQSPSPLELNVLEQQLMQAGWKGGYPVFKCELHSGELDAGLRKLSLTVCGTAAGDLYEAVRIMSQASSEEERWILIRLHGSPQTREDSLLSFALTTLQMAGYRFFLFTQQPRDLLVEGSRKQILPPLDSSLREDVLRGVLCRHMDVPRMISQISQTFTQPEQIYNLLSEDLQHVAQEWWPAAAAVCGQTVSSNRLTPAERRLLAGLKIAGGALDRDHLNALRPGNMMELLELKGCVHSDEERITLISDRGSLKSLRKEQVREIARILGQSGSTCDSLSRYHISLHAGDPAAAADAALQRSGETSGNEAMEWLCRAYLAGADLSRKQVFRLAAMLIVRSRMKMARQVLARIQKKFGMSFRLGNLYLDYHHRRSALKEAIALAERLIRATESRSANRLKAYFQIRMAGLCLLKGDIEQGEALLEAAKPFAANASDALRGMMLHFSGLADLYRGRIKDAWSHFLQAVRMRHQFRATSLMNLGVVHMYQGDQQKARSILLSAIRRFSLKQDAERLAHAYNNLGIVCKRLGRLRSARRSYIKAIHLSRATGNRYLEAAALDNLAITYANEGRTRLSIQSSRKAARAAQLGGLRDTRASCLNNAGLQYAVRGQLPQALSLLRKSLEIRRKLGIKRGLGATYEHMGLAWLMNGKPVRARPNLVTAARLFAESDSAPDRLRSALLLLLCGDRAADFSAPGQEEGAGDFEMGLYHYVSAWKLMGVEGEPPARCLENIHEAEILLRKAPALYWLGKVLQLKAEYFSRTQQHERAWLTFVSSHNIFTRLGARQEVRAFGRTAGRMNIPRDFLDRMAEKLPFKMLQLVRSVLTEGAPDRVVRRILDTSLEFTGMERAVLLLQDEPPRVFMSTSIDEDTIREFREISLSATRSVTESRRPFVATDAESNEYLNQRPSIIRNRIMSIACLPLQVEDRLLGFLYLDSREGVETLATMESTLLDIFASVVALILNNSMILERSIQANESMRASLGLKEEFPEIVGSTGPVLEMLKTVHQLLDSDIHVLITGETGTGKELIARVLHYCGKRKEGPFVAVNSAALTEGLLESEIFGHEKGAFTGATQTRKGLFEEAQNGTLFLDEIGEMPKSMQAKFLRVLQDGEYRRVGGGQVLHTNARVVLATNRNLQELVENKIFREDLYYRVLGAQVHVPALHERQEDIPILAAHFLRAAAGAAGKKIRGISPGAMEVLKRFSWPGNVRQLKIEMERIVALIDHEWILESDLSPLIREVPEAVEPESTLVLPTLREAERNLILERLEVHNWSVQLAARSLGLTRNGLYSKMKLFGISKGN